MPTKNRLFKLLNDMTSLYMLFDKKIKLEYKNNKDKQKFNKMTFILKIDIYKIQIHSICLYSYVNFYYYKITLL